VFIHIGNNIIISDKKLMGIFNRQTLILSKDNEWIIKQADSTDKTIAIDRNNNILSTWVSPFTVIKRTVRDEEFVWRRNNDQELQRR
jgi:type II secretory pathway component HofQ